MSFPKNSSFKISKMKFPRTEYAKFFNSTKILWQKRHFKHSNLGEDLNPTLPIALSFEQVIETTEPYEPHAGAFELHCLLALN